MIDSGSERRPPPSGAAVPAFPGVDPVGPAAPVDGHPLVAAARDLAAAVLAPGAADADRYGVRRETVDALAAAGLLGLGAPSDAGGSAAPADVVREITELLAGADCSTWFCWAQHQGPVRALAAASGEALPQVADLRRWLLPELAAGRVVSGVAFAHVRRPGPPALVAEPVAGGWRLSGSLDWVTSWDIADVVLVSAQAGEGADARLVRGFLDTAPQPGLSVGEVLDLVAMAGTHTRPLRLDGVHLPETRVVSVEPRDAWLAADADRTVDASPSAFGLTRAVVAELAQLAATRPIPRLDRQSADLAAECRTLRARAYACADDAGRHGPGHRVEERLAARAHSLELAQRCSATLVTALAGAGVLGGRPAGRWAREALFLLVQAQTARTREASLRRWAAIGAGDQPA